MKIKLAENIIVPIHKSYGIGHIIKCKQIMCEKGIDGVNFKGCRHCNIDAIQMSNNNFKSCKYEDIKDLIVKEG